MTDITPQDALDFLASHYRDRYMSPELAKAVGMVTGDLREEIDRQVKAVERFIKFGE